MAGACIDITERKEAEQALRQSQLRLRTMAETVPEVLFTNRPDGACAYVSKRFYDYTGMRDGSAEGSGWTARFIRTTCSRLPHAHHGTRSR